MGITIMGVIVVLALVIAIIVYVNGNKEDI